MQAPYKLALYQERRVRDCSKSSTFEKSRTGVSPHDHSCRGNDEFTLGLRTNIAKM